MSRTSLSRTAGSLVDGRAASCVLAGEVHYFRLSRRGLGATGCDQLRRLPAATRWPRYVPWLVARAARRRASTCPAAPTRSATWPASSTSRTGTGCARSCGPARSSWPRSRTRACRTGSTTTRPQRAADHLGRRADPAPARSTTSRRRYLDAAEGWYAAVMPVIADRLATGGGPVVAVQLDNEIGMLSWVTNSPDLTDLVCDDLAPVGRRERYGARSAAARFGADPYDDDAWAAARAPAGRGPRRWRTPRPRPLHARPLPPLRRVPARRAPSATASTGVPFLINVHGTDDGRGRTFPIGISQLFESYRGAAADDLRLGPLPRRPHRARTSPTSTSPTRSWPPSTTPTSR